MAPVAFKALGDMDKLRCDQRHTAWNSCSESCATGAPQRPVANSPVSPVAQDTRLKRAGHGGSGLGIMEQGTGPATFMFAEGNPSASGAWSLHAFNASLNANVSPASPNLPHGPC
jgi:hypothetical protein